MFEVGDIIRGDYEGYLFQVVSIQTEEEITMRIVKTADSKNYPLNKTFPGVFARAYQLAKPKPKRHPLTKIFQDVEKD